MLLIDLYCKAGGASRGYSDAGFGVVGVDIEPQPHYPYQFIQMDALTFLHLLCEGRTINGIHLDNVDAFHASPPCQIHSAMTKGRWKDRLPRHREMIGSTRELLKISGRPYVIENVVGAPLITPVMLCGTMFGLQTKGGSQLRRHRLFECSWGWWLTPVCDHRKGSAIGFYGGGQHPQRRVPPTIGVWGHAGGSSNRDGLVQFGTQDRRDAMGIDWMTGSELSQAIPPAYTRYIGERLLDNL